MEANPFVSVIIPVYNDSDRLMKCLHALKRQKYFGKYEVIIIDNGSDETLQPAMDLFPEYHFYNEKKPGSYAARNKGIVMSKGDILAFTDSDCVPANNWIQEGVKKLINIECCMVGGKIEFNFNNQFRPNLFEIYDSITSLDQERLIRGFNHSVTANLFVYKSVFKEIGYFNSELMSMGDREWGMKAYEKDYKIDFAPEVIVKHPARNSFKMLYKRNIRIAGGKYYLNKIRKRSNIFILITTILPPIKKIFRLFIDDKFTVTMKIRLSALIIIFKYITVMESIRLLLGNKPKRS